MNHVTQLVLMGFLKDVQTQTPLIFRMECVDRILKIHLKVAEMIKLATASTSSLAINLMTKPISKLLVLHHYSLPAIIIVK